MVLLARHEESIKARLWFAFQYTFPINLIQSFTSLESLWTSSSSLCQKLSKVFWFSKPWKLVLFILFISSPFAKKNSPRTNRLNSFCVSLLPFPKERRTNRLNSFVSPFSLVKEFFSSWMYNLQIVARSPLSFLQKRKSNAVKTWMKS